MKINNTLVSDLIRARRTIHDFVPDKIPEKSLIISAIKQARWAPNHRLTEPWHFYLIGPETAEAVCQLNADLFYEQGEDDKAKTKLARWRTIPGWILVTCERSDDALTEQEDYAACCCAIQNLSLLLWQEGIGMKWSTGSVIRDPRIYDLAWVDIKREFIVGLLWYGYPKEIPSTNRSPIDKSLIELP